MYLTLSRSHFAALSAVVFLSACSAGDMPKTLAGPVSESPITVEGAHASAAPLPAPILAETTRPARTPRRGVITAGDIDDGLNLAAFVAYQRAAAGRLGLPRANLARPVTAQLVGPNGKPAPGVHVTLRKPGATKPFYNGYSGVDGMVTVFPAVLGAGRPATVELRAFGTGQDPSVRTLKAGAGRQRVQLPQASDWQPEFLDLAIVLDTTGSMGDELAWLTKELRGIVNAARKSAPGVDIRYALVVYRDDGDAYVVRNRGFTKSAAQMTRWLRKQSANGGGDYPEAAAKALASGAALNWRRGKGERWMFHIADAPAHDRDARAYLAAAQVAAGKNVQIFGLGASGVAAKSEFLMRQAAVQTGGRYMFLTDDSGVGNGHVEPTISCYRVTKLRDLMIRVLRSELSGHRQEAAAGQVVRSVGSYRDGVCQN